MPLIVVLCDNIYDEDSVKRLRGEAFEASQEFVDMVVEGDEQAGRPPRITVVQAKRGRPRKDASDED